LRSSKIQSCLLWESVRIVTSSNGLLSTVTEWVGFNSNSVIGTTMFSRILEPIQSLV